jgi:hypothetical protein
MAFEVPSSVLAHAIGLVYRLLEDVSAALTGEGEVGVRIVNYDDEHAADATKLAWRPISVPARVEPDRLITSEQFAV